jgi:hypothetical protein
MNTPHSYTRKKTKLAKLQGKVSRDFLWAVFPIRTYPLNPLTRIAWTFPYCCWCENLNMFATYVQYMIPDTYYIISLGFSPLQRSNSNSVVVVCFFDASKSVNSQGSRGGGRRAHLSCLTASRSA